MWVQTEGAHTHVALNSLPTPTSGDEERLQELHQDSKTQNVPAEKGHNS